MGSNYKRLGKYIKEVNKRNIDLNNFPLLGVSVKKIFIPSIANTVGTDFSKYKIVERNQFTYIPDTSRRGEKIGMAFLESHDSALVSQAYTVFEVIDDKELHPEYLMMWFRRPEFDRYARVKSHGSVREIFDWSEMCDIQLPIPSPEKQLEIVKEYNTIQNRIQLNNQLITKLEETAQAIYKQWFVDFEFPDENGKPYKSNGGEMIESELGEIPKGWEVVTIKDFCKEMKNGATPSRDNLEYWNSKDIPWIKTGEVSNNILLKAEEYISELGHKNSSTKLLPINTVLMAMYGATAGQVSFLKFETTTNQACCAMICDTIEKASLLYFYLLSNQKEIANMAIGGAQPNLSKNLIEELSIVKPNENLFLNFPLKSIIDNYETYTRQNQKLTELKDLLLAKMTKIN
ncbi:type I restriction enzyme S subunit [Flavobacterium sp. 7E]|uniref:restriction endonuclease subunit S n=1 Tax=Flavobacterium sp. 7E TaxID=2735898 RepID=UPI0015713E1E|nr:restriction endonuclease subunit S [Flavobacterium sp. 7E]NRS89053.1 type I restriction enzyme S subunit [Flavobacterium sp. 7E]